MKTKGEQTNMKKLMLTIGCVIVAVLSGVAGTTNQVAAADVAKSGEAAQIRAEREEQRRQLEAIRNELQAARRDRDAANVNCVTVDAKQVRLKSILSINDTVLAETNRFPICSGMFSQLVRLSLDKQFGGFSEVYVRLGGSGILQSANDCEPHRLRSVELRRQLPDDVMDKDLASEWQASCDFVANILKVESPKVQLVDVEKWRKRQGSRWIGICSRVTFELVGNQYIDVRLTEPVYAMRNGQTVVVHPGYVEIDLTYNRNLYCDGVYGKTPDDEKAVEKEIDFGPDCRDKLAEALKTEIEKRNGSRRRLDMYDGDADKRKSRVVRRDTPLWAGV